MKAYTVIRKDRKILEYIEIKDGLLRLGQEYPGSLVVIPYIGLHLTEKLTFVRIGKKSGDYIISSSSASEDDKKILVLIKGEPSNPEFFLTYSFKVYDGEIITTGTGYLLSPIPCLFTEGLVILNQGGYIEVENEPPFIVYFNDEDGKLYVFNLEEWEAYQIRKDKEQIDYI